MHFEALKSAAESIKYCLSEEDKNPQQYENVQMNHEDIRCEQ